MTTAIALTRTDAQKVNSLASSIRTHTEKARSDREALHAFLRGKGFSACGENSTASTLKYTVHFHSGTIRVFDQAAVDALRGEMPAEPFFELFKYAPAAPAYEFDRAAKEIGIYEATRGLFSPRPIPECILIYTAESWRRNSFAAARRARKGNQARQQRAASKNRAMKSAKRSA
jgi:hypothetical protein